MLAYGKNVLLMTDPRKIKKVYLNKNRHDEEVINYLKNNKIHYLLTDINTLNKMSKQNHQGIILDIEEFSYQTIDTIENDDFIVMLDHLEDPHNFGAIIRTCEAAGVRSIIIPKDRSVSVNDTVIKTSVGTTNSVNIIRVTNLNNTIKNLQRKGYFVYGTDMNGKDLRCCDFSGKKVLIIGNEGKGMSDLTRKNCDEMLKIPMLGKVNSLNASVAAGILIFKMGGLSWMMKMMNS